MTTRRSGSSHEIPPDRSSRSIGGPRVLVFYPSNERSLQLETTILAIHRRGIRIALLTTCGRGPLHGFLESQGVDSYAHPVPPRNRLAYYLRQIGFLATFCRQRNVTTVFSNLQHANLIAVFAQYLMHSRVVLFRHHFKFVFPGDQLPLTVNRMERLFDAVVNRLGKTIVVPSMGVYAGMRATENVDIRRVVVLPYVYDFAQSARPDPAVVERIRSRFPARLILLMCARMVPFKRHALVFPVIRDLIREGLDIRMFVLGAGPEEEALRRFVSTEQLNDRISMLGFVPDPVDYMAASDLLIHPSLTEASNHVVKEMALVGKTAIVCQGVGDFDEYVEHGRNGFLVPRTTDGAEIARLIRDVYRSPDDLEPLGKSLRATVLERFSLKEEFVNRYLALIDSTGPEQFPAVPPLRPDAETTAPAS